MLWFSKDEIDRKEDPIGPRRSEREIIVIGENMPERVIPYAERIGASYYKFRRDPSKPQYDYFCNNLRWIRDQMRARKEIIDIGPDERRRATPRGASPFYEMEWQEISRREYPLYTSKPRP